MEEMPREGQGGRGIGFPWVPQPGSAADPLSQGYFILLMYLFLWGSHQGGTIHYDLNLQPLSRGGGGVNGNFQVSNHNTFSGDQTPSRSSPGARQESPL